jgi:hypothetical protein
MATNVANPFPNPILKKSDLDDDNLTLLNQILANFSKGLNDISGINGPISLANHINLNGNRIQNVGAPVSPTDAIPNSYANDTYGAKALAPAFNALGKQVMQTYRQLSNPNQREMSSSFLNNLHSSSPTTNTSIVIPGTPSGGFTPVTITGGLHQFMDRSQFPYAAYNDSLPLATIYTISGTLTRTSGVVSGATSGPNSLVVGDTVAIVTTDHSFNGQFVLVSAVSPNFTYNQSAPDGTSAGGTISFGNVYYYLRFAGQSVLHRVGPFGVDSWGNRLPGSYDQSTLIAVVVVNGSGVDVNNSSAGATPPAQTNGVRIFGRL